MGRFWRSAVLSCAIFAGAAEAARPDLFGWELICYCTAAANTPEDLIENDANGKVLYHAQSGVTREQLQQTIGSIIPNSQLQALLDWNLLRREGAIYTTAIPVIGPEKSGQLRQKMRAVAAQLEPDLRPQIRSIAAQLRREGHASQLYAVMFSYVLDGLTWDALRSRGAIRDTKLSVEHPFWNGTFWAIYPPRGASPGTNSTDANPAGVVLRMTITEAISRKVNALMRAPTLDVALQRAVAGDCQGLSVEDLQNRQWHSSGSDGRCGFPVIREGAGSPVYVAGRQVADRIAEAVMENNVRDLIGGDVTTEQAHVIATHELIWEVLGLWERKGVLTRPAVLDSETAPDGLLPLMMVTVRPS